MPFLPKVLNNSFPVKMVCECETYKYFYTVIHRDRGDDMMLCPNMAYLKFDINDEAIWLCAECLKHTMEFIRTPEKYHVVYFADGTTKNWSVR